MTKSFHGLAPTPGEWARARRLQTEYDSLTEAEAEEIAHRLAGDCYSQNYVTPDGRPDVGRYTRDLARNSPVEPSPDGKPFAFWSYESAESPGTDVVGHRHLAQACAEARGYQVLETTPTGQKLDSYRLFEPSVIRELKRHYDLEESEIKGARKEAWKNLSRSYTQAARGEAYAFAPDVSRDSVLGRDELPELKDNPDVGTDRVRFVLPLPEHAHLPPSVQAFMEHDEVRAQVLMETYVSPSGPPLDMLKDEGLAPDTPPPHALADKLGKIDLPPALHDERDRAISLLRSADSYADLDAAGRGAKMAVPAAGISGPGADPHSAGPAPSVSSGPSLPPVSKGLPGVGTAVSGKPSSEEGKATPAPAADFLSPKAGPPVRGGAGAGATPSPRTPHSGRPERGTGRGD